MTIFTPPKRKISLASMVLGTLLMTSFSAGNANALPTLPKCAECNRITCQNSKILNHCVENCDYSSIVNCVNQKCSQLSPANKKRLVPALQEKLSAKEKEHADLEEQIKTTLQPSAALSGTGKTAATMAGSSNKEQVKLMKKQAELMKKQAELMKKQAELMKEINILRGEIKDCSPASASDAPSTPGADTPSVSPAASHEDTTLSPDKAQHEEAQHEEAQHEEAQHGEAQHGEAQHGEAQHGEVNEPAKMVPSLPVPPRNQQKPMVANSETNTLQAQLNRALEKRKQKKNSNNESSPSEGETPQAKGAAERQKIEGHHTKLLPVAQAAHKQLNPVVTTVTPSTEETTSPAEEKGAAETSRTQSETHLQGPPPPPPPPPLNLAPPPKSPPPPMGNVTHSQGTAKVAALQAPSGRAGHLEAIRNGTQLNKVDSNISHKSSDKTPPPTQKEDLTAQLKEKISKRNVAMDPDKQPVSPALDFEQDWGEKDEKK